MSKLAVLIISILITLTIGVITYFTGFVRDKAAIDLVVERQRQSALNALLQITTSIREDLIQGNLRQARNTLERVKNDVLFVEYAIRNREGEVEKSSGFDFAARSSDNYSVSVPVAFSEGGEKWGAIEFVISKSLTAELESSLRNTLFGATLAVSVAILFVLNGLFVFLWVSNNFLSSELSGMLRKTRSDAKNGLFEFIWRPTLRSFAEIAKTNDDLNRSLSRSESEAALYQLSTQVAHDIRAPLSALQLVASAKDLGGDDVRSVLISASRRISQIADDLVAVERHRFHGGSKTITLFQEKISFGPVVAVAVACAVFQEASIIYQSSKKQFIWNSLDDWHACVGVEEKELARCISNLIGNAVDVPSANQVRVGVSCSESWVQIFVCDDGQGIPSHVLQKVGKERVTFGKSEMGTGLGLLHASKFAEENGGKLAIESREGGGTRVTIELPRIFAPRGLAQNFTLGESSSVILVSSSPSLVSIFAAKFEMRFRHFDSGIPDINDPDTLIFIDEMSRGDIFNPSVLRSQILISARSISELEAEFEQTGVRYIPRELIPIIFQT